MLSNLLLDFNLLIQFITVVKVIEEQSHVELYPLEQVGIWVCLDHLLRELINKGYVVGWMLGMRFDWLIRIGKDHLMEDKGE